MGARSLSSCFAALILLLPAGVSAQETVSDSVAPVSVESYDDDQTLDARYWLWGETRDTPSFGGTGGNTNSALYQRLNLDLSVEYGSLSARLDVDAFTGRLAGDRFAVEDDELPAELDSGTRARGEAFGDPENILDPRNAYLGYRSPVGELRLGLQTSNYGLGLLANDGEPETWNLFGQPQGGDRPAGPATAHRWPTAQGPKAATANSFWQTQAAASPMRGDTTTARRANLRRARPMIATSH
jgi:hypothetical protein